MKFSLWLPLSAALAVFVSSCANHDTPDDGLGYGPFDAQGNYREDLADNPSMWTKPGKRGKIKPVEPPVFAANDEVPAHSLPIASRNDVTQHPMPLITGTKPSPTIKPASVRPKPAVARSQTTAAKKKTIAAKPKTTTKKAVVKTKLKPKKPAITRYSVKSGDSLSRIASRHGVSVSALKRQNGLSKDLIRPGQSLVIPKR